MVIEFDEKFKYYFCMRYNDDNARNGSGMSKQRF